MSDRRGSSPNEKKKSLLFGLYFDPLRMEEVVARCRDAVIERRQILIGVLNAAKLVYLRRDHRLRDSLLESDVLLADGQSVVWASRVLGKPLPERVAGIDLFECLLSLANKEGYSVYLLGARQAVLEALVARIRIQYPALKIAGYRNGYFEDRDSRRVAALISKSRPDMLFIGMPSPKKEIFLSSHRGLLNVPVLHGVGGSFDVLAGMTKRAPLGWQRLGMEWAYRLFQEPGRLWRRYLATNVEFLVLAVCECFQPLPAYRRDETKSPLHSP